MNNGIGLQCSDEALSSRSKKPLHSPFAERLPSPRVLVESVPLVETETAGPQLIQSVSNAFKRYLMFLSSQQHGPGHRISLSVRAHDLGTLLGRGVPREVTLIDFKICLERTFAHDLIDAFLERRIQNAQARRE
ncbi:hypothetical protein [Stigmatella erecta]|uniref:hypothetical protein n=1 Tax=Stigmatella erecta TaxID=83460 RepID=UPI0011609B37|nr:hypothetical protein [Stigmatella erecta]